MDNDHWRLYEADRIVKIASCIGKPVFIRGKFDAWQPDDLDFKKAVRSFLYAGVLRGRLRGYPRKFIVSRGEREDFTVDWDEIYLNITEFQIAIEGIRTRILDRSFDLIRRVHSLNQDMERRKV